MALRHFIAQRGQEKEIHSDNGTNFTGTEKELRVKIEGWNQAKIHKELLQKRIQWYFNPMVALHHGGARERMIRSTRKILGRIVKEQTLNNSNV